MEELLQYDKDVLVYLNNLGNPALDSFWILVSEKWFWIPLYIILLYLLYKQYGTRSIIYIFVFCVLGVLTSDQLSNFFKNNLERLRPCHDPTLEGLIREIKCGGQFGFYSAHASNTFFIATYVGFLLKNKYFSTPIFLFIWAFVVAYSRIYLGVHFPLDVLVGASIGVLLGLFYNFLVNKTIHKQVNN